MTDIRDIRSIKINKFDNEILTGNKYFKRFDNNNCSKDVYCQKQKQAETKFKSLKKLKPFEDADKDGIPNCVDRYPFKKNKTNKMWRI